MSKVSQDNMRLLSSMIDWEYPQFRNDVQSTVIDLQRQNLLMQMVLAYGNGIILEHRVEGESAAAIEVLRGLAAGTGGSNRVELSEAEKKALWLYHEGDECYRQPMSSGGYTFINPKPQPQKFKQT